MARPLLEVILYLVVFAMVAITVAHGYCVMKEKGGYRKDPRYKWHPELKGLRFGDRLLVFHPPEDNDDK